MERNESEQMSIDVPMHKRMAMGEKLDGTSLGEKSVKSSIPKQQKKPHQSGLATLKKK